MYSIIVYNDAEISLDTRIMHEDFGCWSRGYRLESIKKNGLELSESTSSTVKRFPVKAISSLAPDDRYDFVLVVVQRTQIRAVLTLLVANQSPNFVFMVNTAAGYQAYADAVGADRVMLAFPSAGGKAILYP